MKDNNEGLTQDQRLALLAIISTLLLIVFGVEW